MQVIPYPIAGLSKEAAPFNTFVQEFGDIVKHREFSSWTKALESRADPDQVLIEIFKKIIRFEENTINVEFKPLYSFTLGHTLKLINEKLLCEKFYKIYAKSVAIIACEKPLLTLPVLSNAKHRFIFPSYPLTNGASPEVVANVLPLIAKSDYFTSVFTGRFRENLTEPSRHYGVKPEVFQAFVKLCTIDESECLEECFKIGISEFVKIENAWCFDEKKILRSLNSAICKKQTMESLFAVLLVVKQNNLKKQERLISELLSRKLDTCIKRKQWGLFFSFLSFAVQPPNEKLIEKWFVHFFLNYKELSTCEFPADFFETIRSYVRGIPKSCLRRSTKEEIESLFSNVGSGIKELHISKMKVPFSRIIPTLSDSLRKISFSSQCRIGADELALLVKQCPNIESLKIAKYSTADLTCLSGLSRLTSLSICAESISLKTLPLIPLQHLSLSVDTLSDCSCLTELKSTLKSLRLTKMPSIDCVDLLGLELEKLSISTTTLDNISRLGEIDLSYLHLSPGLVNAEEFLYLTNALPDCHISK